MATLLTAVADFETTLASAVAVGATTATLESATDDDGVALPSGLYGFTVDKDVRTSKEYFTATLSGTALTGIESISRQGTATAGFARAHRYGAKVTITDWAILSRLSSSVSGGATYAVVSLTDGVTVATNAALGNIFDITLGGNRTFSNPTNPSDGQIIEYRVKQDATGSRTITWGAAFAWTTDVVLPSLSTTAAKIDHVLFQYRSAESKWFALAVNKGAN